MVGVGLGCSSCALHMNVCFWCDGSRRRARRVFGAMPSLRPWQWPRAGLCGDMCKPSLEALHLHCKPVWLDAPAMPSPCTWLAPKDACTCQTLESNCSAHTPPNEVLTGQGCSPGPQLPRKVQRTFLHFALVFSPFGALLDPEPGQQSWNLKRWPNAKGNSARRRGRRL